MPVTARVPGPLPGEPKARRKFNREHLKRPRLPAVKGGDWLHPMMFLMIEATANDAWAIREGNSRYFTDHHAMTDKAWRELCDDFEEWVTGQRFGMALEVLGLGEPEEVSRIKNRLLCIAFGGRVDDQNPKTASLSSSAS